MRHKIRCWWWGKPGIITAPLKYAPDETVVHLKCNRCKREWAVDLLEIAGINYGFIDEMNAIWNIDTTNSCISYKESRFKQMLS